MIYGCVRSAGLSGSAEEIDINPADEIVDDFSEVSAGMEQVETPGVMCAHRHHLVLLEHEAGQTQDTAQGFSETIRERPSLPV